jgi:C-3',4' desaturase CrtD
MTEKRVVIVGAGIGGLTAGALLAKAGLDVTVLEAHVYPGGCAGSFYHQGYRFEAGATLAAGFGPDGAIQRLGETLGIEWPVVLTESAMAVHLPDGSSVTRWVDRHRWQAERLRIFGEAAEPFWHWQEETANAMWDAALRGVPWPPATSREWAHLAISGGRIAASMPMQLPGLLADAVRPAAVHLRGASDRLRSYVDGQLLISAQATSERANALYGAAALDMPQRGVAHVKGGIGKLAEMLASAVCNHGGRVLFRQRVTRVATVDDRPVEVETSKGVDFPADIVLFNLPPWDAAALLGDEAPQRVQQEGPPPDGWGAFLVYAGLEQVVSSEMPLHRQVLVRRPFGEGNSVFVSLSLPNDPVRAPKGHRAATMSTHTRLEPWWRLLENDRGAYEARKQEYTERVLDAAEMALPGLRRAVRLVMPGTPVSFQRFTHRSRGWVGGFPQTSLTRIRAPRLGRAMWLVGDSIFPGQSALAVALGGVRVAQAIAQSMNEQARIPCIWNRACHEPSDPRQATRHFRTSDDCRRTRLAAPLYTYSF